MKKLLFFLAAILIIQSTAFAQFTNVWKKLANGVGTTDYPWFNTGANNNNVASLAFNPSTGNLLVSNRNTNVYIIDAANGTQLGTLSNVGLGTEAFKFNKIRVDADGVIYGISLNTGATIASPTVCKIYRWASQLVPPVECASFTVTERTGDSFGLSGTGANTVLYTSGAINTAGNFNIYILNTINGTNFTTESKVTITPTTAGQAWANRAVEPVSTGVNSDIWIKGGGFITRRISISAPTANVRTLNTVVTTIADGTTGGQASIGYGGMRYITGTANKFLVFAGGNNSEAGTVMRALNVTNEALITLQGTEALYPTANYLTNGNGSGDVSFKVNSDGSFTTFYLSTNNGIGATTSAVNVLPVSLTSFNANIVNNVNTLTWETASERNNLGFEIESSTDGKQFSKIGFVPAQTSGNSNSVLKYSFQDNSATASTTYYRLKQIDNDGKFEYFDVKFIKNPFLATQNTFKIYPNPVTSYIEIDGVDSEGISVKLFNTSGSEINRVLEKGRLNMSGLDAGIYILRISKNGTLLQTTKVVKQ